MSGIRSEATTVTPNDTNLKPCGPRPTGTRFRSLGPDDKLDSLNKKGAIEAANNMKNFKVTSDMRVITLKHRADACHRRDFSKGRN